MKRALNGMVVVITGASAGIGLALARELAGQGAKLALCARRLEKLQEIGKELGEQHLMVRADVSKSEDCRNLIEQTMARFGRIDTLVCNAGYGAYKLVEETDDQETRRMFEVDVVGTTECIRFAVPHLRRQQVSGGWRGQIMIVSSAAGRRGTPFIGVYSGTKAAQLAIAEALRVELRDARIAVTTVHPTPTTTEFREVAENQGQYRIPPNEGMIKSQTAEHVAKVMAKAMARPRAEVWPHVLAGWALSLGTLWPGMMDRLLYRYYLAVMRHNSK
jgi:3-oxoacyl-[acyl-carrier protein] reductase